MSVACGFSIGISRKQLKHALTLTAISITAPALFYLPTSMSVAGFFQTASLLYDLLFPKAKE
jgi:hypothetical protein